MERGLIVGALMVVAGLVVVGSVFLEWRLVAFGPLPLEQTIRPMLVGGFLIALGFPTILMSCFYRTLGLSIRGSP